MKLCGVTRFMNQMNTMTSPNATYIRFGLESAAAMAFPYILLPRLSHRLMRRNMRGFLLPEAGRRSLAHITGDRDSATTVDMSTDTAMVMVNWR